ncbi:ribosomal RNA small subunit methyltransferase A [Candidatus Poribacteria bacterium]|nr:MAG: ribosomal RNA small subunit methyltransferase A [Candidatus Poribacteria bacterium]
MTLLDQVKTFLRTNRIHPKKQLGQHFLVNEEVLPIIIEAGEVSNTDVVIEIGAGLGFLTTELASNARKVIAVEVDSTLYGELDSQFGNNTSVDIIHGDFLALDISTLIPNNTKPKVIANLPYAITTPILWKLLEHTDQLSNCVLMMQREVAERIVASPGGKDYGALTIGISYYADTTMIGTLLPNNFYPEPKVESALLGLSMLDAPRVTVENESFFFRLVRESFRGRRKMLKNTLKRFATTDKLNEILLNLDIAPQRRPETLDIGEFAALANVLHTNI